MTTTIAVTTGPVATQVVAEGDGETLVINSGPATVFFGDDSAIRATDNVGIVGITPNSYFAVNGESDLFACVASGQQSLLSIITGGLNFFLPVTSLTIPYGATGQRIVINPPGFPGSIVGYNDSGNVEFVIAPNGYLLYDATGGALNHLFLAIQNQAGSDTFGNPFAKGITVGPNTGPQVLIGGGNPAFVSWPLNDSALFSSPAINGRIVGGVNPNRWGNLAISGAQLPTTGHRDYVMVGLNSPSADGSSFGNGELDWVDTNNVVHGWQVWDGGGVAIFICRALTAADPSVVATPSVPAVQETWHDLRPLLNSFIGTVAGQPPPQYRKCADGDVQIFGLVRTPPTTGNYSGMQWGTLLPAYRPNKTIRAFAANVADGAATPVLTIQATGALLFSYLPASLAQTDIFVNCRFPLDNTGIIQS